MNAFIFLWVVFVAVALAFTLMAFFGEAFARLWEFADRNSRTKPGHVFIMVAIPLGILILFLFLSSTPKHSFTDDQVDSMVSVEGYDQ